MICRETSVQLQALCTLHMSRVGWDTKRNRKKRGFTSRRSPGGEAEGGEDPVAIPTVIHSRGATYCRWATAALEEESSRKKASHQCGFRCTGTTEEGGWQVKKRRLWAESGVLSTVEVSVPSHPIQNGRRYEVASSPLDWLPLPLRCAPIVISLSYHSPRNRRRHGVPSNRPAIFMIHTVVFLLLVGLETP